MAMRQSYESSLLSLIYMCVCVCIYIYIYIYIDIDIDIDIIREEIRGGKGD